MRTMKVHISPEQRAFIREGIESGRFRTEEDAVQEALALWEERERLRSEILAAVDKALLIINAATAHRPRPR